MKAIYGGGGEGDGGEVYTAKGDVGKRYDGEELEGWARLEEGRDLFDSEQNLKEVGGGEKGEKGGKKEKKEKKGKKEKKEKKVKSEKKEKKEKSDKKDKYKRGMSESGEKEIKSEKKIRSGGGGNVEAASWMGNYAPP